MLQSQRQEKPESSPWPTGADSIWSWHLCLSPSPMPSLPPLCWALCHLRAFALSSSPPSESHTLAPPTLPLWFAPSIFPVEMFFLQSTCHHPTNHIFTVHSFCVDRLAHQNVCSLRVETLSALLTVQSLSPRVSCAEGAHLVKFR